jgi:hypothetical protein
MRRRQKRVSNYRARVLYRGGSFAPYFDWEMVEKGFPQSADFLGLKGPFTWYDKDGNAIPFVIEDGKVKANDIF